MTKGNRSTETRRRILDAAETLFARQGYSGTTTRQIAARAGVSIQTLQYHSGGKRNLYKTVMESSVDSVTSLINRYVQKMLERDLTDARVLEESVTRIIDELFDVLHARPSYAFLFYRQWLVLDPDLRGIDWAQLIPILRQWSSSVEEQLGPERLRGTQLFLLFMSLGWIYWGPFIQPDFIASTLGIDARSPGFLSILKEHAREMTLRMMQQREPAGPAGMGGSRLEARKARPAPARSPSRKARRQGDRPRGGRGGKERIP